MAVVDSAPNLLVDVDGPVATLTLNRPARRNALTPASWVAIGEAITVLDADPTVAAIVLTGAGPAFCAGFDLRELAEEDEATRQQRLAVQGTFVGMLPPHATPIVAAINGPAVTGGLELALACDILVAGTSARFADTHAKVGAVPGGGLTLLLPRRVGPGRARLLSLTGSAIDAETALAWGLVDEVVDDGELLARATAIATQIAALPTDAVAEVRAMYGRFDGRVDPAAFAEEQAAARAWMAGRFDRERLAATRARIVEEGRR